MAEDKSRIKMTETVRVAKFDGDYDPSKKPIEIVEVVSEIEMENGVEVSRKVIKKGVIQDAADQSGT